MTDREMEKEFDQDLVAFCKSLEKKGHNALRFQVGYDASDTAETIRTRLALEKENRDWFKEKGLTHRGGSVFPLFMFMSVDDKANGSLTDYNFLIDYSRKDRFHVKDYHVVRVYSGDEFLTVNFKFSGSDYPSFQKATDFVDKVDGERIRSQKKILEIQVDYRSGRKKKAGVRK